MIQEGNQVCQCFSQGQVSLSDLVVYQLSAQSCAEERLLEGFYHRLALQEI